MQNRRTPEEWAYLIAELKKMAANPLEPREKRAKAQQILDQIDRPYTRLVAHSTTRDTTHMKVMTDIEYDGQIV